MKNTDTLRLAVDIGGTFTDTVLMDGTQNVLASAKTATTPRDPAEGALEGIAHVLRSAGRKASDINVFIHGTTLATNALIERRGAKVGTITTHGFRDILEIAYERRYSQYDIALEKPDLIVPRSRSFTIRERMSFRGDIIEPLDEAAVGELAREIRAAGIEALAICLLHAYANGDHERRLRDLLLSLLPELDISLSCEVSPEAREFDRLCTTIANAYIQRLMGSYLLSFQERMTRQGMRCPILMMTASGAMTTLETAATFPIRLVESGPAGGAILAARIARQIGETEVLSFDMGGTTAKLCLIDGYRPQTARKFEISRAERFIRGSGMPVRIPVIEMIEIGAGGGSIASVDSLGRLNVGPRSAGSEPGPAAFGKGGSEPTVTDSDFALGYLDPQDFAEGRINVDMAANRAALSAGVGKPLGLGATEAAAGISEIVDESMASAGRMHAVESGKDMDRRVMIAFGGNGPLHATRVARRAGVNRIIIPRDPGVGSAIGFLFAPIAFELVQSRYTTLEEMDLVSLNLFLDAMQLEAERIVRTAAAEADLECVRTAFMRYRGQGHELEISLPARPLQSGDEEVLKALFEEEYRAQFTRSVPGMEIEILNWGTVVSTRSQDANAKSSLPDVTGTDKSHSTEIICDLSGARVSVPIYRREAMRPGQILRGPVLLREVQTTTLVSADFTASMDDHGNIHLNREAAS